MNLINRKNRFDNRHSVCIPCDKKNNLEMGKIMDELIEIENDIFRKDQRLMKSIESIKGYSFYNALCELIKELDQTSEYSIVDNPKGNYQKEYWHKEIQGIWVDQWCNGGYAGDDFAGYVYVKIKRKNKRDRYLKIPYLM